MCCGPFKKVHSNMYMYITVQLYISTWRKALVRKALVGWMAGPWARCGARRLLALPAATGCRRSLSTAAAAAAPNWIVRPQLNVRAIADRPREVADNCHSKSDEKVFVYSKIEQPEPGKPSTGRLDSDGTSSSSDSDAAAAQPRVAGQAAEGHTLLETRRWRRRRWGRP
eukprot:SAG22_NODE_2921_length_2101_cov_4.286713_2_plen_169_part_00